MKVAIATDDYKSVTGHVGKCSGFLIVTIENGEVKETEERENNFTNHGRGNHEHVSGHGHHDSEEHKNGHQRLADGIKDCSHLICHGVGWRLVEDLTLAGIKPILTNESDAITAAIKLENGTLDILEDAECRAH
ncbi:MAG: NifB/NifX family molybdenum-iron cluster-binding protein [Melioribacteraceae bacterium]|nr:NifB/NifX family molybdenum-iron cluster-binding protein [Melioribacteraceae bacterium]